MVEGASLFLFCHDDVAPDPDAVHLLVEEAFRSNAGVVAPKLVSWDDPARLLHVGMAVDKGGAVVDRVEPGEIDHGQHDAVRDVFLAPGGCTLVRADLFAELGGFDPDIFAMGEDLDLCWRAQVLGPGWSWPPAPASATSRCWRAGAAALPRRCPGGGLAVAWPPQHERRATVSGAGDGEGREHVVSSVARSDDRRCGRGDRRRDCRGRRRSGADRAIAARAARCSRCSAATSCTPR